MTHSKPDALTSKKCYEITRAKAIKAISDMWDVAFPERSGERLQDWAEAHHLCAIWDPDSLEDQQDAIPPGIWDLMLALGVTPAELIEHCHANPKLFEDRPSNETNAGWGGVEKLAEQRNAAYRALERILSMAVTVGHDAGHAGIEAVCREALAGRCPHGATADDVCPECLGAPSDNPDDEATGLKANEGQS
jgi:hypothetical protein